MPIIVNQISSPLNATEQEVISTALKKLGSASKHAIDCEIHKSSLDARKRNDIHFVHSVFVTLDSADLEKKLCEKNTCLQACHIHRKSRGQSCHCRFWTSRNVRRACPCRAGI